ncbi:unnamed protein product [Paramecium sonneborni]|uniref:Uncharacterized protein n=1 Tax=Paramecium sonneborni TaxID=65129 RepID=A0A8S1PKJ3_9CILI|nr:unnamed protein product [Paramecium sonneborni]
MGMNKEDIMSSKGICHHHMMYTRYLNLDMSYKNYRKLSKQFRLQNIGLHRIVNQKIDYQINYIFIHNTVLDVQVAHQLGHAKQLQTDLQNFGTHVEQLLELLQTRQLLEQATHFCNIFLQNPGWHVQHVEGTKQLMQLDEQLSHEPLKSTYPGSQPQVTKLVIQAILTCNAHQNNDFQQVVGHQKNNQQYLKKLMM